MDRLQELVEAGQFLNKDVIESPLIQIDIFPDGGSYIRDGHHRCIAIFRSGRTWLDECEYIITERSSYDDFINPHVGNGWYTPFDPRTEIRLSDFKDYKKNLKNLSNVFEQLNYINNYRHMYCKDRDGLYSLTDLNLLERINDTKEV